MSKRQLSQVRSITNATSNLQQRRDEQAAAQPKSGIKFKTSLATIDRTSAEGKASSVQFVHFEFSDVQIEKFKDLSNEVVIGIEHIMYAHTTKLTDANRKALALDIS